MRHYLFILTCILLFSCQTEKKSQKPAWLYGKWKRTNEKPTKTTFEFWNKDLTGIGYTLKETDTVFKETMSIVTLNNNLYLKIEGINENPTIFKFIKQTDTSFICVNKQNEFPKKIHYYIEKNQLKCIISNSDLSIDFIFSEVK